MGKTWLVGAGFLLLAAAPPPAPVEPVTDDFYGIRVSDDYRWMESGKDPHWMPWLKAQGEHTKAVLGGLAGREALLRDDPYANIRKGNRYPATMVISGINDPRAATFHSAKYAAKLAASSSSGKPVLLRIDFEAGHGIGSSRSQADAQWADMLSFVLWQAGDAAFQPRR